MQVSELLGGGRGWLAGNQSFRPAAICQKQTVQRGKSVDPRIGGDAVFSTLALAQRFSPRVIPHSLSREFGKSKQFFFHRQWILLNDGFGFFKIAFADADFSIQLVHPVVLKTTRRAIGESEFRRVKLSVFVVPIGQTPAAFCSALKEIKMLFNQVNSDLKITKLRVGHGAAPN